LNNFRAILGLKPISIKNVVKTPFADSLREYSMKNDVNFHVEIEYDDNIATIHMTFMDNTTSVSGLVKSQSLTYPDDLDKLEEFAAKRLGYNYH